MGIVFIIAGYGWLLLGAWTYIQDTQWGVLWSDANEAAKMAAFSDLGGIILLAMVLPGLIIAGLGHIMRARK